MRISKLKEAIREMIIGELNEVNQEELDLQKDYNVELEKTAKLSKGLGLTEDEALTEMAKIAGDLKTAIEKVIEKNKDGEKKDVRKAIKADSDVQSALGPDDDLFDNQLNKFIDLVRGEREVGQRGRKTDPNKPDAEKKEGGMRGRPKSATPAKKKDEKVKTFSVGKKKYYAGSEDEEGPSDKELKQLARSGGKFEKGKTSQLQQQEKTKMVKAFLKDLQDKGIVDSANRVLDKEKYAAAWAKSKPEIEAKVKAVR